MDAHKASVSHGHCLYHDFLLHKGKGKEGGSPITVEDIVAAEILLTKKVQAKQFPKEVKAPDEKKSIKKHSNLQALDPFQDVMAS